MPGNLVVTLMMLASSAFGLAAMALGSWGLWASAGRFTDGTTAWQVSHGFAVVAVVVLLGSFARSLHTLLLRPLAARTPDSDDKLDGLLLVMAPAVAGLTRSVYLVVAMLVLRLAHGVLLD